MKKIRTKLDWQTRQFVEWTLKHYPETSKQVKAYRADKMPSMIAPYSASAGHSSGEARPTEQIAIGLITDQYLMQASWCTAAVDRVISALTKPDYQLVDLIYFKASHTVAGAGLAIGMSDSTARRRVKYILTCIAREMGLITL